MNAPFALTTIAALGFLLGAAPDAQARRGEHPPTRSDSPYFVVKGAKPGQDALPLEGTRADVDISGVIAKVRVTQTYKNDGETPLEAIYVFPGSTRAAVFGMKMTIGERTIVAKINKKEEARKIYEQAKSEGKSASLLEQKRPNVFQMNVANIMPGDRIVVQLDYTELLVPEGGVYELVYPAVVGPRYTGESDKPEGWTKQGYTGKGEPAAYAWDIAVHVDAGVPIQSISSSSHRLTKHVEGHLAEVRLAGDKAKRGDRDFVLQYRLAGKAIQSGLLMFPGDKESHFLMMLQPPKAVAKQAIPKREYVFILDVSGSMRGFPLDTAKTVMRRLLKQLRPVDTFNMMYFSGRSALLSEKSLKATGANVDKAFASMDQMRGGGGTRILAALRRALALPTADNTSRTFVVVTDGYISVEEAVFEEIRANLGEANLFAFGIGSSVNRHLIEGMARAGMGEPFVVLHGDDAGEKAEKFRQYIASPALTGIDVAFKGFDAYDVEPKQVPDLFAERPVVVFGKYRGAPKGTIKVTGATGAGRFSKTVRVADYEPSQSNEALRYLWARHRIAALSDLNKLRSKGERVEEITRLGLEYSLMTAYTSFVAVDSKVRNTTGESKTVKQPLPLPAGVPETAVGSSSGKRYRKMSGGGGYGFGSASVGGALRRPAKLAPPPSPAPVAADEADAEKKEAEEKPRATVRLVDAKIAGALSEGVVKRIVRARLRSLGRCSVATGQVKVKLVVGADGKVLGVTVTPVGALAKAGGAGKLRACLEASLRQVRFPTAAGTTAVMVTLQL